MNGNHLKSIRMQENHVICMICNQTLSFQLEVSLPNTNVMKVIDYEESVVFVDLICNKLEKRANVSETKSLYVCWSVSMVSLGCD